MKCFIFALKKEARPLLEKVDAILKEETVCYTKIYECEHRSTKFFVAVSGMGKVFAASAVTAVVLSHPEVDEIINTGVGGSNDKNQAAVFDCVISSKLYEHDLDSSPIGDPVGMISGIEVIDIPADEKLIKEASSAVISTGHRACVAPISSGDQFIATEEQKQKIRDHFDSISYDMESAAMGQVALVCSKPFVALRIISDCDDSAKEYAENLPKATEILSNIILKMI